MTTHTAAARTSLPEDMRSDAFRVIGDMEDPIEAIRAILASLAMMAETMDDDEGTPVQRLAWLARDQCAALESLRGDLFKLFHPNREGFEKVGWPGEEPRPGALS